MIRASGRKGRMEAGCGQPEPCPPKQVRNSHVAAGPLPSWRMLREPKYSMVQLAIFLGRFQAEDQFVLEQVHVSEWSDCKV